MNTDMKGIVVNTSFANEIAKMKFLLRLEEERVGKLAEPVIREKFNLGANYKCHILHEFGLALEFMSNQDRYLFDWNAQDNVFYLAFKEPMLSY